MRLFTFSGIILLIISCSTGDKNPIEGVWELDRMSWNNTTITPLEPRKVKIYLKNKWFTASSPGHPEFFVCEYGIIFIKYRKRGEMILFKPLRSQLWIKNLAEMILVTVAVVRNTKSVMASLMMNLTIVGL